MKFGYYFSFLLAFLFACTSVQVAPTVSVEKEILKNKNWSIAVFDLQYELEKEGTISGVRYFSAGEDGGKVVANIIAADMAKMENIRVIDRNQITKVLEEQALQQSGIIDSETAVQVGKLVGANAVVVGELTDYVHWESLTGPGSTVSFSIRMIDSESSRVVINSTISRARAYVEPIPNAQLTIKELVESIQKQT